MRYRAEDANDDYQFGGNDAQFYIDRAEAVGQAVKTRLQLRTNEWFLDLTDGTPYDTDILGTGTATRYDQAIQERILGTTGVIGIDDYSSVRDSTTRALTVEATIRTIYGQTTISQVLQ